MVSFIQRSIALVKRVGNDHVLFKPYTSIDLVDGGVASINNATPDEDGNVTLDVYSTEDVYTREEIDSIIQDSKQVIPESAIEDLFK